MAESNVAQIRVWYDHTRMVREIVPYAYGTYRTRMVCTVRVWYVPYANGTKYAYGTQHAHLETTGGNLLIIGSNLLEDKCIKIL